MLDHPLGHRVHLDGSAQQSLERRYAFTAQTAWNNRREVAQVRVHVEGKPVRRNPARDVHSHRHQLVGTYPHARGRGNAAGANAKIRRYPDQHFLERAHVPSHVAAMPGEVENGIPDELPGPVVGDVAAAVRLKYLGAQVRQPLRRGQQVFALAVPSQGINVWVLEQQESIRDGAGFARRNLLALEADRLRVINQAELLYSANHNPRSCVRMFPSWRLSISADGGKANAGGHRPS